MGAVLGKTGRFLVGCVHVNDCILPCAAGLECPLITRRIRFNVHPSIPLRAAVFFGVDELSGGDAVGTQDWGGGVFTPHYSRGDAWRSPRDRSDQTDRLRQKTVAHGRSSRGGLRTNNKKATKNCDGPNCVWLDSELQPNVAGPNAPRRRGHPTFLHFAQRIGQPLPEPRGRIRNHTVALAPCRVCPVDGSL